MLEQKECLPLLDIETVMPILKHISVFAGLSGNQLLDLFKLLEKVSYEAGETIFEQGTEPNHIYIIKSGRVQLSVSKGDTVLELAEFECGDCLGEASIIGIRPHSATAVAVEDSELIVLSRRALMSIYESDTGLFSILILNIAREISRRLHDSSESLLYYEIDKAVKMG